MREVRWERMFPDELEAAFAACPVVYFTYGLCEPHGPQSAVGLDGLKAHAIACEAARQHGGIVAPPHWWHIHDYGATSGFGHQEIGDVPRAWLTPLPPWHFFKSVLHHVRTADALGFAATLLVSGHWTSSGRDLARMAELLQPHVATRLAGMGDWDGNDDGFDGVRVDHAGKVETSLLWAVEPECVDLSRLPHDGTAGPHWAIGPEAERSNRRVGERMAADEVAFLGATARRLLAEHAAAGRRDALVAYDDVETLWRDVVRPALPTFETFPPDGEDFWLVPDDSRWAVNRAPSTPLDMV